MVRYAILHRFLREIPPKISLWNTCISAWLTPRQGHLRGVKIPDAESWSPFTKYKKLIDDATHTISVSDDYEPDFGSDDENDWSYDNADNENNKASHKAQNFGQIADTSHNPPPQHDNGHIKTRNPRPSDTFPFKCTIISQNVNSLGGSNDDKLKKIISLMIDRNINAYCLQETCQTM